ncbi:MAG: hypothetical protein IJ416_07335 [Ruminiclostridium sp.]|nr:hypothetical protein [Ruminiclostridium sp.]
MNNITKRTVSAAMALLITLGAMPVTASAAGTRVVGNAANQRMGISINERELSYFTKDKNAVLELDYKKKGSDRVIQTVYSSEMEIRLYTTDKNYAVFRYNSDRNDELYVYDILRKSGIKDPSSIKSVMLMDSEYKEIEDYDFDLLDKISYKEMHENYDYGKAQKCDEDYYEAIMDITEGNANDRDYDEVRDEGGIGTILDKKTVKYYNSRKAALSFEYSFKKLDDYYSEAENFEYCADFEIFTKDKYVYECSVSLLDNPYITAKEIVEAAGVPKSKEITAVRIDEHIHIPEQCQGTTIPDHTEYMSAQMGRYLEAARSVNLGKTGWQTVKDEKFYVKKGGTLITKDVTINGIRYEFDKNGVCEGKYTGWVTNSKGKRYYKKGVLIKNKWIKLKNGERVYAGKDGYIVD